jgi:tRNA-dihydrouridine synthase
VHSFWQTLHKPFLALAPMEDVTDTVFREIILSVSDPALLSVVFTEFTSTDGLCHEKGKANAMGRLLVSEREREILNRDNVKLVAQIWGSEPEKFYKSARLIAGLGLFDGIDINMGCPVKKVVNHKSCSALINYPDLASEIVQATKEGSHMPVSVKTRLGFKNVITEKWIGHLLESKPEAIIIHGRTQKMMSDGDVLWDEIAKAVQLRNNLNSNTIMLGNGDILEYSDALSKVNSFGLDGIMIGRGVFKNPWIFNRFVTPIAPAQKIALLKRHLELFESTWNTQKNYNVLKRFYKIYLSGFRDAALYRGKLMETNDFSEAKNVLERITEEIVISEKIEGVLV